MKITYIHQYFTTPGMTGGTRSYEMARRMVDAGHQVQMITSRSETHSSGAGWVREKIDGIDVHWLPVRYENTMGYVRRLFAFGSFAAKAGRYAARFDTDVVFATSTPLTVAVPGIQVSRSRKVPMVFEVRDLWPELPIAVGALNFPFAKPLARELERRAYANSTRVVALSPGMCEGVARTGYPANRISCIPNSSDTAEFDVSAELGERFRQQRDWLADRPLVIYAGTFGKINGVSYLADLAASMRPLNPEVRFLAVGRGAEAGVVADHASRIGVLGENFFIEDALPKREMPALFSASTVSTSLVIPLEALWNNSANKFFDSLAAGRPIVINYGGWQADLIEQQGIGLVLDPEDPQKSAQALNEFLKNDEAIRSARSASRHLAESRFSRDKLAGELIQVLDDARREGRTFTKLSSGAASQRT
ncbi:MAG: glycosyltransferase family 4 protein [Mesorhizobium sp.]